jgi:hypothetical protein
MKGIVFADFVEFVEHELPDAASRVAGRSYSALETYPEDGLHDLVTGVAEAAGMPAQEVLRRFGAHLFRTLATLYPVFLDGVESALDLLAGIETYVHGEVKKLYPDAEFPRFEVRARKRGSLELIYRSRRPLADLAEGMIQGCVAWFGDRIEVDREDLDAGDGRAARFRLRAARARPSRRAS